MALVKCIDCGKEISDNAKICIYCGCPIEKKIKCIDCGTEFNENEPYCSKCGCPRRISKKKNFNIIKKVYHNQTAKTIIVTCICIVALVLSTVTILNNRQPSIDIGGTWKHYDYLISGHTFIETYEFEKNGKAKYTRDIVGTETRTFKCTYKFKKNNTQIKISCNYDTKEIRKKNNIWVNFEMNGDTIYIDNKEYKNY